MAGPLGVVRADAQGRVEQRDHELDERQARAVVAAPGDFHLLEDTQARVGAALGKAAEFVVRHFAPIGSEGQLDPKYVQLANLAQTWIQFGKLPC